MDSIYTLSLMSDEFEAIVIDDCSTDNTATIVNDYARSHTNLTLLCQSKNHRQGAARNKGISASQGEYICFIDSDDIVTEGIVSAIRLANDLRTEVVAMHHAFSKELGKRISEAERLAFAPNQIFSGIDMQNTYPYWCSAPWGYIYSKEFILRTKYPFAEGVFYEDSDFIAAHLYRAKRMAYSPNLGYTAYVREGSTTRSNNYTNAADYLLLGTRMLSLYSTIIRDIEESKKIDDSVQLFADSIREGVCYNITNPLKHLYKLRNKKEIIAFYERVDVQINRSALYYDSRIHRYSDYWNLLAIIGMKHKFMSIALNSCLAGIYHMIKSD